MTSKRVLRRRDSHLFTYILLAGFALLYLVPIFWLVISSFKEEAELFRFPPSLLPERFSVSSYVDAWGRADFALYFKNTTIVTIAATMLTVVINLMAGYAFAKYKFRGSNVIFMFFMATMMLPLEVLMIPIFQMVKAVGFYNSFWGLIVPPAATPAGVFIVRQYFLTIPDEIMESARIDGAGETKIFLYLMVPLAKPAVSVLAIFSFLWRWNDYMWPLIVIRSPQLYTVQLALKTFAGEYSVDWNGLLAMSVITMIPMLVIFLIFQKQFIQGIATSGLKE